MTRSSTNAKCIGLALLVWMLFGCSESGPPLATGSLLPDFTVKSANDASKQVSVAGLRGKPILIDFWATWCGPCRQSMPHLQQLWQDNKDKGLEVLAITDEEPRVVAAFQTDGNIKLPCYIDDGQKASQELKISGLPTTIVIGKDGRVIYAVEGASPDGDPALDDAVAKAVQ